jgi:tRNA1Val (adenine37-N6)-methyltransferase
MSNSYFRFKQFTIHQEKSAMKVTTDGCLFGAWIASFVCEDDQSQLHCLDIGTGTGLLSLMVAQKNSACIIDAVEIEAGAAEEAANNITGAGKNETIFIHQSDIRQFQPEKKYAVIFSNPPFYENELKGSVAAKNAAHHDAGLLMQDLLDCCRNLLLDNGRAFLLLPFKREIELTAKIQAAGFFISHQVRVKQSVNHGYFRTMLELRFTGSGQAVTHYEEIAIKDEKDQYTETFTALLRDYYLYL